MFSVVSLSIGAVGIARLVINSVINGDPHGVVLLMITFALLASISATFSFFLGRRTVFLMIMRQFQIKIDRFVALPNAHLTIFYKFNYSSPEYLFMIDPRTSGSEDHYDVNQPSAGGQGSNRTRRPVNNSKQDKVTNDARQPTKTGFPPIPTDSEKGFPLLQIKEHYYTFNDLIVKEQVKRRLEHIVAENRTTERLRSFGLKPKQKILFCGPPGTGKTLSAKIMSSVMGYPFVYVLFDAIVSSYLGETATNLRRIFDFIEKGKWVVLFDEFDIVGKKRDDPNEHGEVKRVVNNFMQMMDNYEGDSILIAATNHEHLLDNAIWRRFDEIIYYELPDTKLREELFAKYLRVLRRSKDIGLAELAKITNKFSPADIAQVCEEAMRRSIISDRTVIEREDIQWAISEQNRKKSIMSKESKIHV